MFAPIVVAGAFGSVILALHEERGFGRFESVRIRHRARVLDRAGDWSGIVVGMTPEEIADLVHLRRARDLMDRNYAQPLDVPAMARTALMSPAHFSRKFRAAYGETPYSYLMTRRIERAKALLRQGKSVTETCVCRRLHVARLVQFALHRDRRRDAVAVPHTRPPRPRSPSVVREHVRNTTAAYHGRGLSAADLADRLRARRCRSNGCPDPPLHQAGSEKHASGRCSYGLNP